MEGWWTVGGEEREVKVQCSTCVVTCCWWLSQVLKLYYPRAIYGVDRDGDPISYNAIGNIDFRGGCCLHVMQHVVFDRTVQEVVVGGGGGLCMCGAGVLGVLRGVV